MTDAKKQPTIVPLANLIHGSIFDKRGLQVPFPRVISAINEIDPDFAGLMQEGKGYTLILEPVTLTMIKAQQEQYQNPNAQPQYQRQPHMAFGGYGNGPVVVNFGLVANGHDRVLILPAHHLVAELSMNLNGMIQQHQQLAALQFCAVIDEILGDAVGGEKGFVAE